MNKLSPFGLKNFEIMIKTYVVFCLAGSLIHFVAGANIQRERSLFFVGLFFILIVIVSVGKKCFLSGKYEKLGLWLLYLSMISAIVGFPLIGYAGEVNQSFETLLKNCGLMFFIGVFMCLYIIVCGKYGRKLFSESALPYVVIVPVLLLLIVSTLLLDSSDSSAFPFVGIGGAVLSLVILQYKRIGVYFEQKNSNRYGSSVNIVKKEKGGKN